MLQSPMEKNSLHFFNDKHKLYIKLVILSMKDVFINMSLWVNDDRMLIFGWTIPLKTNRIISHYHFTCYHNKCSHSQSLFSHFVYCYMFNFIFLLLLYSCIWQTLLSKVTAFKLDILSFLVFPGNDLTEK